MYHMLRSKLHLFSKNLSSVSELTDLVISCYVVALNTFCRQLTHVFINSPDISKSRSCISNCQHNLSTRMPNRHLKLSTSPIKLLTLRFPFLRTKDLEVFQNLLHAPHPHAIHQEILSLWASKCVQHQSLSPTAAAGTVVPGH